MSNIVEVAVADKSLSTMVKSVKAAGLEETLSSKGPFTVFAPDNKAFGKLAAGDTKEATAKQPRLIETFDDIRL